ncbi:Beta-1,4-galactosyltransferase 3 [Branchiostoma belcheri]|nr:Beta-1,4-galactosyltransferase 3 [Branchiostoma belcheri]
MPWLSRLTRRRWKTLVLLLVPVVLLLEILTSRLKLRDDDGSCPAEPPDLRGPIEVNMRDVPVLTDVSMDHSDVRVGGHWSPPNCTARHKVAVLIPYRDRREHLHIFLNHIHPILKRQLLDYGVYVIEQYGDEPMFCKGLLYNVGFSEVLKNHSYDCFIFHDVDLLLEDDRNAYSCSASPRHLSVAIDKFNYTLPYKQLFGGVTALSASHYQTLNGYSNLFCGWGGEDDDMYKRLVKKALKISRPEKKVARYKMMRHEQTKLNPSRFSLLKTSQKRLPHDGLKNLHLMNYELASVHRYHLYTHIAVTVFRRKSQGTDSLVTNTTLS